MRCMSEREFTNTFSVLILHFYSYIANQHVITAHVTVAVAVAPEEDVAVCKSCWRQNERGHCK